jgi:ribosomal protein L40E
MMAIQDEQGVAQYVCKKCGALNITEVSTRRMSRITVMAPKGEEL